MSDQEQDEQSKKAREREQDRQAAQEYDYDKNQIGMIRLFLGAVGVLFIGILSYASQFDTFAGGVTVVSVGLAVAGAFMFAGALIGFLFGIPKTLQTNLPAMGQDPGNPNPNRQRHSEPQLVVNTNLSDISDWLTKILVGVGLTQLNAIPGALGQLAAYLAPGFGARNDSGVFALGVVLYAWICGFFIGYLWTRLFLSLALRYVDRQILQDRLRRAEEASQRAVNTSNEVRQQVDQLTK
jgi:hypothetical protein